MTFYLIWIPAVIIFYAAQAYLTKANSQHGGHYFYVLWIVGAFPLWALVSRYSKDVLFDGTLYDLILCVTYILTLLALGVGQSFSPLQWLGVGLILLGFVLMKLPM